jgi:uncharacterized membrane protein
MRIAVALLLLSFTSVLPAHAQFTTPQQADQATPVDIPTKAPDMVCFGEGPNWSIQLQQGRARRLGINQPDSFYTGKFVWVPNEGLWNWTGDNTNGQGDHLVVTITQKACVDNQRKETFPYNAQTMLPTGDIVFGCCRKLRPGEAAVGPEGVPPSKQ